MDKLVYLTYPALLLIILIGSKFYKKGEWNEEFMSLKQTKYIQGLTAICIMLHHIGQETCASWQTYKLYPGLEFFVPIGYMLTAVFFMCSGFGLYKSYTNKQDYLKGFILKRILPLVFAYFISNWIFFICRIIMKEKIDGWKTFCYISGWGLPNLYAWFVVALPIFYLFFYLAFKFAKKDGAKIALTALGVFAYQFVGTCIDHNNYWMRGEWWYNCVHLFWIGMIFARYEKEITQKIKKKYVLYLILAIVGTFIFFNAGEIVKGVVSYYGEYNPMLSRAEVVRNRWICLIVEMLSAFSFVSLIFIVNMKLRIGNRLLGLMGGITLEFYLIHGLFLEFFSYKFCEIVPSITRITNVALLIVVVFALSVPSAMGLNKLMNGLRKLVGKN